MMQTLSQKVETFADTIEGRKEVTLGEACKLFGSQGSAVISAAFSLPFVLFIPIPGLSMLLGAVIFFNGWRIARKKPLWLPRFLANRPISSQNTARHARQTLRFLKKIEKIIRPRGVIFQTQPILEVINGIVLACAGFFLLLPLPPGTNFLPGLAACFLSLGILEQDLLFVFLAYTALLANIVLLIAIPLLIFRT